MALRNLSFPTVMVHTPGGDFAVRGVTPDMVLGLYHRHSGELSGLFDHMVAQMKGEQSDATVLVVSALQSAPLLLAELIALASGSDPRSTHVDPDLTANPFGLTDWERDVSGARELPLPIQVDALTKIAAQTFTSEMPAGKFLAVVIQMAGGTTALLKPKS